MYVCIYVCMYLYTHTHTHTYTHTYIHTYIHTTYIIDLQPNESTDLPAKAQISGLQLFLQNFCVNKITVSSLEYVFLFPDVYVYLCSFDILF
jgi:hypothetical protein